MLLSCHTSFLDVSSHFISCYLSHLPRLSLRTRRVLISWTWLSHSITMAWRVRQYFCTWLSVSFFHPFPFPPYLPILFPLTIRYHVSLSFYMLVFIYTVVWLSNQISPQWCDEQFTDHSCPVLRHCHAVTLHLSRRCLTLYITCSIMLLECVDA